MNASIAEGVHRANPQARVIFYDWGWKGHGDAPGIIARLPKNTWLMSVSEWSKPLERGGVRTQVGEYAMSVVGPGPRAERHWELARVAGLKTVAKVQFNNTWELSAVPYLPVMDPANPGRGDSACPRPVRDRPRRCAHWLRGLKPLLLRAARFGGEGDQLRVPAWQVYPAQSMKEDDLLARHDLGEETALSRHGREAPKEL